MTRPSAQELSQAAAGGVQPGMPAVAAIQTMDLTRQFGSLTAVNKMNLTVYKGMIFGLLGPNGAGKSTTIKMLTTLLPPSGGTAKVSGFDIRKQPRMVRSHLGYIPQAVSAESVLTGYENMQIFAKLYGVPHHVRKERIDEALQLLSLSEFAQMQVKKYSGGMTRRLEIAIALVHRPPLLILDEPTVGLDPTARRAIWERLHSLREQNSMTILITTHQMAEAEGLCDQVAIMNRGVIAAMGSIPELKASLGPDATLDDVFISLTGSTIEEGGFADAARTRRASMRRE